MGPGQKTQLQQQAQMAATRPGQPGTPAGAGPQQQPSVQGQGLGMGQNQAKPGQMGPAGGPMGQARQTGPGNTLPTMVSKQSFLKLILFVFVPPTGFMILIITIIFDPERCLIRIIPLLFIFKVSQVVSHVEL